MEFNESSSPDRDWILHFVSYSRRNERREFEAELFYKLIRCPKGNPISDVTAIQMSLLDELLFKSYGQMN